MYILFPPKPKPGNCFVKVMSKLFLRRNSGIVRIITMSNPCESRQENYHFPIDEVEVDRARESNDNQEDKNM